jgi:hypothetical protein
LALDLFFLDDGETLVVREALRVLGELESPHKQRIEDSLERLGRAADLVRSFPPIPTETLIELLCKLPDYDLDLHVPTKVVLGQAYLVAKINFLKAVGYALDIASPELRARVEREIGQSIYSKLAEELFLAIVTDAGAQMRVKVRAARALFEIWEQRLSVEIDDFAPVLESVWVARNNLRPVLGTLRGTHELLRMLADTQDHSFLDHFTIDEVPDEEVQAFEEFLFGISHEEIEKLRVHLETGPMSAISEEDARALLGHSKESWAPGGGGPQALFTSYKKRKVNASHRAITSTPGPKRTAEEYVMMSFLERDARSSERIKLERQ